MTEEEIELIRKLINALAGPTFTFRTWDAQTGRNGREGVLERAAVKIHNIINEYATIQCSSLPSTSFFAEGDNAQPSQIQ